MTVKEFIPFPKQKEFQEAVEKGEHSVIIYGGAIRGGKTYVVLGALLTICRIFPGSRYAIVRESMPSIRLNVFPSFNQLVPQSWTKQMPTQYNNWTWIGTNDSEIIFFPENFDMDKDLERFKGLEIDGVAIEEISEIQEATFYKCIERRGTYKMGERKKAKEAGKAIPPQVVLATCNPTSNWVKSTFYDPWVDGKLKPNWLYIQSKVYDNPHVPKEWIEEKRQELPAALFDRFVDGDWNVITNDTPWFYAYDEDKHVYDGIPIIPDLPVCYSHDFNVDPITAVAFQTDYMSFLHIFDEFVVYPNYKPNLERTKAIVQKIKEKYPKDQYMPRITGDASGKARDTATNMHNYALIIQEWQIPNSDAFLRVRKANLPTTKSCTICNMVLHHVDFRISVTCEETRKDMRKAMRVTKTGKGDDFLYKDASKGHAMNLTDCVRYALDTSFPDIITNFKKYQREVVH